MLRCSVGVMVYNEEANLKGHLHSLLTQKQSVYEIDEVIIISSGSTDRSERIVEEFSRSDPRVRLIIQAERLGKASAVNLFLQSARRDICIVVNGDSVLERDAVEQLMTPFLEPGVGMTGARSVPIDSADGFVGYVCRFMWKLHHEISSISPKMGELIAFKKDIIDRIPKETAVDEVCIESKMKKSGYKVVYTEKSRVYIRVPDTVKDFMRQRRRIAAGHIWAWDNLRYTPSTRNNRLALRVTLRVLKRSPATVFFTFGAALFECAARILGIYDYYIRKKNPYIWKIAESTKTSHPALRGNVKSR